MDMDYSEAYSRLKTEHEFMCERQIGSPTSWDCKECPYYYKSEKWGASYCLKKEIEAWVLYRLSVER